MEDFAGVSGEDCEKSRLAFTAEALSVENGHLDVEEAGALRKKQETKEIIAVAPENLVEVELEHALAFDCEKTAQIVVQAGTEGHAQKYVVEIAEIVAQQARHPAAEDESRADD